MKRVLTVLLMLCVAASLFAGGAENKSNQSTGYLRNPSKNTETKKPDAVFYNQAGTAFMEEGLYLEAGNQFLLKNYTNDGSDLTIMNAAGGTKMDEYSSTNPTLLYPNVSAVWNGGNYAVFGSFGVVAGGGSLEYDLGTYTTNAKLLTYIGTGGITSADVDHSFNIFSATFAETIGASYSVNDMFSASAAIRFTQGKTTREVKLDNDPTNATVIGLTGGDATLADAEATANGIGYIFGLQVKPIEKLDVALQYQTMVKMEYEWDKADGALASDFGMVKGEKYDQDLPAVLGAGVGYQINDPLYASISFNYYFNDQADMVYDDSWEIGAGAEYQLNEKIAVSGGVLYSKQGYKDDVNSPENPLLDSFSIAGGAGFTFIEDLDIDFGVFMPIYFDADYDTGSDLPLSKTLVDIGISATYKLF